MNKNLPLVLIVLDGWGIADKSAGNAIELSNKPHFNSFLNAYAHTQLLASGESVGLPKNEDGNSEVGHLNLGAGRIVYQDLPRINMSIADGSFLTNQELISAVSYAKQNNSKLHLIGLFGSSGVHSSKEHLYALLNLASQQGFKNVFLHLFTDGRDSPPQEAGILITELQDNIKKAGVGKVATVSGRYYGMDRDNRWDRVKKAYDAMTAAIGTSANSAREGIEASYANKITDEFIEPIVIQENGKPVATVADNDAIIFFNFRPDRARELTKAFILPDFNFFTRSKKVNVYFVTMTEYEKGLPVTSVFKPEQVEMPLTKIISDHEVRQLHIAETEKYPHVTYFFNGGKEDPYPNEDRVLIPSPKVSTYDLKPEMSAFEITDALMQKLSLNLYEFVIVNFANADMVGHTGKIPETVKAVEVLDDCIGKIVSKVLMIDGTVIITADHGNAEEMINPQTGGVDTEHSVNPVPFIAINKELGQNPGMQLRQGILADVAPTVLDLMGIEKPESIRGTNLISGF